MNTRQIKLNSNEFWPLLNVLNEVCHGIKINDFESSIGVEKQAVVDFLDNIAKEEHKSEVILSLNDSQLTFLKNSFEEVFRQIDEWEFQTRIGISAQEARKIQEKLK
jgi:hypothetical protein